MYFDQKKKIFVNPEITNKNHVLVHETHVNLSLRGIDR